MILCRVIGNSVSSVKHPSYVGQKVMVLQPVETDTHTPRSNSFLALDSVHAGVGDLFQLRQHLDGAHGGSPAQKHCLENKHSTFRRPDPARAGKPRWTRVVDK